MLRHLTLGGFAVLSGACGSGASSGAGEAQLPVSAPSVSETRLLDYALSEPDVNRECIDQVTASPERPQIWADTLSFGDGQLALRGDPRYDEAMKRWGLAAPNRPYRLRLPAIATRGGGVPVCDWRLTFYPPYFDHDMAFVVADKRHARGEIPGGQFLFWIFRNRDNRWNAIAYGQYAYGGPVI